MLGQPAQWDRPAAATIDRRQWGRFVADVGQLVVEAEAGDTRPADVWDESFGGIGLLMDDVRGLEVGNELKLTYDGTPMRGVVRNVLQQPDGRYRVGIEWQSSGDSGRDFGAGAGLIEGRLLVLFRMWEAGEWDALAQTVATLKQQAEDLRLQQLTRRAGVLLDALRGRATAKVPDALADLVDACTTAEDYQEAAAAWQKPGF